MKVRDRDDLVGTTVDGFEVRRFIAEGGMGRVYEAYQKTLDKRVALKILHPEFARRSDVGPRLKQEAKAASRVKAPGENEPHENVARVENIGELPDGRLFIMYEFLDGRDLEDCLGDYYRDDAVPRVLAWDVCRLDVASAITVQVCRALDCAHFARIVHRDIKPPNIMLIRSPRQPTYPMVKVLDWGIAWVHEEHRVTGLWTLGPMGTPLYMAPEQLSPGTSGEHPLHLVDIWAVGCVYYRLLTCGHHPFPDRIDGRPVTHVDLYALQRAGQFVRPSKLRPELDPRVDVIVERCLALNPAARYPNARALALDVVGVLDVAGGPVNGRQVMAEVWPDYRAADTDLTVPAEGPVPPRPGTPPPPAAPSAMTSHGAAVGSREATAAPRRRSWALVAAAIAVVAIVSAVAAVLVARSPGEADDGARASAPIDAAAVMPQARVDAGVVAIEVDASVALVAAADAGVVAAVAVDAGVVPVVDAGVALVDASAAEQPKARHRETGMLHVEVLPFAEVSIDGKYIGTSPVSRRVAAGKHKVLLEGKKREVVRVNVKPNEEKTISRNWKDK